MADDTELSIKEYKTLSAEQQLFYDLKIGELSLMDLDAELLVYVVLKLSNHPIFKEFTLAYPDYDNLTPENYTVYVLPARDIEGIKTSSRIQTRSNVQIQMTTKQTEGIKVNRQLRFIESVILSILFNHKECRYRNISYVGSDFTTALGLRLRSTTVSLGNNIVIYDETELPQVNLKGFDYKVI